jgi:FtsH-binding integral membrane protein
MTTQIKKRDDEKSSWLVIGILFTAALIGMDIFYSSINEMAAIAQIGIWALHVIVTGLWVLVMAKFNDPNYDGARMALVIICVISAFIIGIHHATVREDNQVIIDSKENATKP